jgi:hypothetical protein
MPAFPTCFSLYVEREFLAVEAHVSVSRKRRKREKVKILDQ